MSKKTEMTLSKLTLNNFKQYEHEVFELPHRWIAFRGPNEAGKTSALQAIALSFGSKDVDIPEPIRRGASEASIEAEFNDGQYTLRTEISMKRGKPVYKSTLTNDEGDKWSNPSDKIGEVASFDIRTFIKNQDTVAGRRKNKAILQQILGIDLNELEDELADAAEKRAETNKAVKIAKAQFELQDVDMLTVLEYSGEPMDAETIMADIQGVKLHNEAVAKLEEKERQEQDRLNRADARIKELAEEMRKYQSIKNEATASLNLVAEELEEFGDRQSDTDLVSQLNQVGEHNARHNKMMQMKPHAASLQELQERQKVQNAAVDTLRKEILKVISESAAGLPEMIALQLDEKGSLVLMYKDKNGNFFPLNSEQTRESAIIEAATYLGAKLLDGTNLKLMTVRDASLLDKQSRTRLLKTLEEKGISVYMELVDTEGDTQGIHTVTFDDDGNMIEEATA